MSRRTATGPDGQVYEYDVDDGVPPSDEYNLAELRDAAIAALLRMTSEDRHALIVELVRNSPALSAALAAPPRKETPE